MQTLLGDEEREPGVDAVLHGDADGEYQKHDKCFRGPLFDEEAHGSLTRKSFRLEGKDPVVIVEATFSKHRRRDVVRLGRSLLPVLRTWLAATPADEPIFPRLAKRKLHKVIRFDLATAGIDCRTPDGKFKDWHALCHAFITSAWKSGAQPNVVKDLVRHLDVRETLGYSHSSQTDLRDAVERIPDLPLTDTGDEQDDGALA